MIIIILTGLYSLMFAYQLIIFASIVLSWIPKAFDYKIPRMIRHVSDWYMAPFRGVLVFGMIDFTPIIGLVIYNYLFSTIIEFTKSI